MRYYGTVGYSQTVDKGDGVWEETVTERNYYGDIIRNSKTWENGTSVNDDINVNNSISIVADAFAFSHFFAIRYIEWMGTKWKVTGVEVQKPRLILSIGGVYNENKD